MFRVNDHLAQILNPLVIELRRSFEYLETILESFGDLEDPEEVPDPQEVNVDTLEPMMMALEDAIDKILKLSNDYKKTEDAEKKVVVEDNQSKADTAIPSVVVLPAIEQSVISHQKSFTPEISQQEFDRRQGLQKRYDEEIEQFSGKLFRNKWPCFVSTVLFSTNVIPAAEADRGKETEYVTFLFLPLLLLVSLALRARSVSPLSLSLITCSSHS